ncbi:adenosylcobinamide-GDP ribazoletransferase [uncultured Roseovarius sp.]|uniref:adenosylcobinamide-GDP ribazoletransferase n=1 Tax=uncultured Roseovarius sp. TaxID=293344 RepID=UPI00262DC0CF|nr:adenosylcobinamide-GDP ribazoletransferase [uncultured Roseovarius sp.]
MAKNDTALLRLSDLPLALCLLSRLPVTVRHFDRGAQAAWAYPLVGLLLGALAALAGLFVLWLGLPAAMAALVAVAVPIVLSGAMHEDGLADTADGLWGGWTRERRLEIMKDSHIGSYGVIALCLSLIARIIALWLLYEAGTATVAVMAGAMLSRAGMSVVMAALPHARADGLSHAQGRAPWRSVAVGTTMALGLTLMLLGPSGLATGVTAALVVLGVCLVAHNKIGGQTGDILGATQQFVEIAVLVTLIP